MDQEKLCNHLNTIEVVITGKDVCEECFKHNGRWVHLRVCQTCGVTLCCDDSSAKHMSKHYQEHHHPVIASAQPGERWLWCYPDELFTEY
jgi:uncharacterized UBP type Zn finger protein